MMFDLPNDRPGDRRVRRARQRDRQALRPGRAAGRQREQCREARGFEFARRRHVALPATCRRARRRLLVPQASSAGGKLDILVNNRLTRDNLLMRMKDDEFADVIAINLGGAFRLDARRPPSR
jgi:NAD(P)-dependent dehydrogenase (short-subunit alcohol dehydrogenase family)